VTAFFGSFDEYFSTDQKIAVKTIDLNGVLVSHMVEQPNDIHVAWVRKDHILMSLSGSDVHRVQFGGLTREAPTAPMDVALVPKGTALDSSWRVTGRPLESVSLEFDQDLFQRFAPEMVSERFSAGHLVPATYAPRANLAEIASIMLAEQASGNARGRLFSDCINRLLALEIAAAHWTVTAQKLVRPTRPDWRVKRAIDFIEANIAENVSMLDIAAASGLSVSSLSGHFRQVTGQTPYAFVIERRVIHAETLLRNTDLPIAEIALAAGFADQAHLTRQIRARRGTTPRQLRLSGDRF
jgi:AraC family transcriptional regulator